MSNGAIWQLWETSPTTNGEFFSSIMCALASITSISGALLDFPGVGWSSPLQVHDGSFIPSRKLMPSVELWLGVIPASQISL